VLAAFRVEGGMALMLNGWIENFNAFVNSNKKKTLCQWQSMLWAEIIN